MHTAHISAKQRWFKIALRGLLGLAFIVIAVVVSLLFFQHRLIYLTQRYTAETPRPPNLHEIRFTTAEGPQVAWYRPAGSATIPRQVWLIFSGNGGTAWQWVGIAGQPLSADAAALLIDWPGYGLNAGSPSPAAIDRSSDGAVAALAQHLQLSELALQQRLGVIGHSLGAAPALRWAARRPCVAVVLFAPFTRLIDMAQQVVGWPLCQVLIHRFDNIAALDALMLRAPQTPIMILHGGADTVVPVTMGRALAQRYPQHIAYTEVDDADHVDIIDRTWERVLSFIRAQ